MRAESARIEFARAVWLLVRSQVALLRLHRHHHPICRAKRRRGGRL